MTGAFPIGERPASTKLGHGQSFGSPIWIEWKSFKEDGLSGPNPERVMMFRVRREGIRGRVVAETVVTKELATQLRRMADEMLEALGDAP